MPHVKPFFALTYLWTVLTLCSLAGAWQQPQQPPPAAANQPAQSKSLSSSLGVYVFPAKNQTPEQQNQDEGACFSWAKNQTGIDPLAAPQSGSPAQDQQAQQSGPSTKGSGAKGAAGGAAAGAAIGGVAGDAGQGAAIGATAGAVRGRRQAKKAQKQAEANQQQQAQTQAQAQQADRKTTYNKAFSACMEGKGYTVK